ncbi:alkaline phosphatase family protein [Moniliophthora roreri MCA 2997]|uniref:Alkaline phosphatase family protein n=1 Tax=Moniliophthora roreri (strain MCA 2997) TaxID=1381753 RepID=V2WGI0_MONRO|nr:alkaline phosphatase family protein [Moniliophthora roreri MCA 2997]
MAGALFYLAATFSTLFRITSYIFLRIIPTTLGQYVLPPLYLLSLTTFFASPFKSISNNIKKEPLAPSKPESKHPSPLNELIWSLPSQSKQVQWSNAMINLGLALACVELAFTPFIDKAGDVIFSRVGAVYPDSAKIVVRYPNTTSRVHISWREALHVANSEPQLWKKGPLVELSEEKDWIDTVVLKGLWPSTNYEYVLSDANGTLLPYPQTPISFRTFPDPKLPGGKLLRFVSTSCITPNFPYRPLHGRTIKGFDLLSEYLFPNKLVLDIAKDDDKLNVTEVKPDVEFMFFLGDFIYADVPVYTGKDQESYRRLYRRNYQSPSFRKVYERLPILFTYDDHEFINNFEGNGDDSKPPFPNASDAFRLYSASANHDSNIKDVHYYDFRYGDIAFFVMDTRRYRSDKPEDPSARTMLGDTQLAAFHDWLAQVNHTATFKFVVSSVPFTSLWTHDAQIDSWAAYPTEKETLLEAMHSVPNVFILSGDRHEFASIEFNGGPHSIMEFSTSPLSMFYIPFIRTLEKESNATVTKEFQVTEADEEGKQVIVTQYQEVPRERVVKYVAEGNHKWSTFEVDTRDQDQPTLRLELMVNGKSSFQYEIIGTPVQLQSSSTAIGAFVSSGVKDILNKIGITRGRWF